MATPPDHQQLTERQVTLVLQHLGAELAPAGGGALAQTDPEEKTGLVQAFLAAAENLGVRPEPVSGTDLGRAAVGLALTAPETKEAAEDLVLDPPDDEQMGVAEVSEYLALLGFLIAFLQTRFEFKISRERGKTKIDVSVGKEALQEPLIEKIITIAGGLLSGTGGDGTGKH